MGSFWLCFVPLFVAVDPIGIVPLYLALTERVPPEQRRKVVYQSVATAAIVSLGFVAGGSWLLNALGVTVADFMIAGGILLFCLSLVDLMSAGKPQRQVDPDSLGAVPLGVPLIAGPAVLTTSLALLNTHGMVGTVLALILNLLLAGAACLGADRINARLGKAGMKALSKMTMLLAAAIGVMLVRRGVLEIVHS